MTGLWQVSGRSTVDYRAALELDVHYVRHKSLWFDLKILLRTVRVVFDRSVAGEGERAARGDSGGEPAVERDRRVIRECRALEDAGYRVSVICPRGARRPLIVPDTSGARVLSYPQPFAGSGPLSFAVEFAWSFAWIALRLAQAVMFQGPARSRCATRRTCSGHSR